MSICPWCKGKMLSANDVCPSCGKNPYDHPSISAGSYGNFDAFDDFEDDDVGGLDVAGGVAPLTSQEGPDVFGGDSFEQQEAAPLKLEIDAVPVRAPAVSPSHAPMPSSSVRPVGAMPPAADYRQQVDEVADSPPMFDAYEIAVLADFGPAPQKIWEYPGYSIRVTTRRRELRRRMELVKQSVQEAERSRDDRLADLAERLRPQLAESKELAPLLSTLEQIEQTAASRNEALSERNQEMQQKLAVVDREIEGQRGQQAQTQTRLDATVKALEKERETLNRATAALKRAEIELRNAQQVARAAAGPQARTAPPEHAAKLQHLSSILEERKAAMQTPTASFDEAKRVWNDADSAHKAVQRRIADLQKQRRGIEQSYAKEIGVRSAGVQQAESERRAACIAIGSSLIEQNAAVVPRELRQAFFETQEVLSNRLLESERLSHAIASADPNDVKKGWLLLFGGSAIVILLLALLVALFGRSEPEPAYGATPHTTCVAIGEARRCFAAPACPA